MKMFIASHRRSAGGVLLVTVVATLIVGLVVLGYMTLVGSANRDSVRSQSWNAALVLAETGVEEAMAHLQENYPSNLVSQGWTLDGTNIVHTRQVAEGGYDVSVSVTPMPVVVAKGSARVSGLDEYISRNLRVLTMPTSVIHKAFATKLDIKLNGNNISSDSYDSTDPLLSTIDGRYDPTKTSDKGDIYTNLSVDWALDAGNANIKGAVSTGPDGTVDVGPNAVIGSTTWHDGGNSGAEDGYVLDESNVIMPPVEMPDMGSAVAPLSGTYNLTNYNYMMDSGLFSVERLAGNVLVTGNATLLVTRGMNITDSDVIRIAPGARLTIYVAAERAQFSGAAVANESGIPTNFRYFGLPTNEELRITGGAEFAGVIYAPDADLHLSGGGNLYGAVVAKSASISGDFSFHFDESLARSLEFYRMSILSWDEI